MKKIRMRVFSRFVSMILAVLMVFTAMPAFSWAESIDADAGEIRVTVQGVSPGEVNEAVTKFADALSSFYTNTSEMSKMSAFLTRFGGLTSAASGVIGILQMSGILKDSSSEMLNQIMDEIHGIQDKLNQMDSKLDNLHQDLVSIAVTQEEKDRNNKASTMLKYWRDFNRDYCEPLDDLIDEYQGKVNSGIMAWWMQSSHEGIRVLYTKAGGNGLSLTYDNGNYTDGFPQTADNGETVDMDHSFGVPAAYLPDTSAIKFNINTYASVFEEKMAENLITAANSHELDATKAFYDAWDGMTVDKKRTTASAYAADILNTQIYHTACAVMSANNDWVIKVMNAYRKYCDNVLQKDSGVNAMLNAMYLTHGFEGEIKGDIVEFCNSMVAKAGFYGQFALTCAGQDAMQSLDRRQTLQKQFTNTVLSLNNRKTTALTGYDNYCYITGTKIESAEVVATSATSRKYKSGTYSGCSNTEWTITTPNMLDNVYSQVLYRQYRTLKQGTRSFSQYLNKYKTGLAAGYKGAIMTKYGGAHTFDLGEGINIECHSENGVYFFQNRTYRINVGNDSDVENQYFHIHDKVLYDIMDMSSETLRVNQLAAARAFYGESHWTWSVDEAAAFVTPNVRYFWSETGDGCKYTYRLVINVLKLTPVHNLNGDWDKEKENPFFAFGAPTITRGVSNYIGPTGDVKDNRKALTSITLKSGSFPYTGKAISPAVTVKAGKKTVPAKNYKVSYMDNKALGIATVTVKAKGNYTGTISKQFRIVPKGTKIKKLKRHGKSIKVKWKKQKAKMPSKRITGYQIRYSTSASMKNARMVKVKGYKKTSKKIKGLKKKTRYYFQIRTYMTVKDRSIYSAWSQKKSVKKA